MTAKYSTAAFLMFLLLASTANAQISIRGIDRGRNNEVRTKNIHGSVQDQTGKPIVGARVQILNTKDSSSRNLITDEAGKYAIQGLEFDVNYEVRADFRGVVSERKSISAMLDREDNLVNFQLNMMLAVAPTGAGTAPGANTDPGPEIQTFDLVKLKASFE